MSMTMATTTLLLLTAFSCLQLIIPHVSSFEFQVGDNNGWVVPPPNDTKTYNDWASEKRFKVGDTVRFRYRKDSVMEVGEKDYKKCNATHPIYFSNTGDTLYKLDHTGLFYFISGAAGHCGKGQRIIIKVLSSQDIDSPPGGGGSGGGAPAAGGSSSSSSSSAASKNNGPLILACGVVLNVVIITIQSSFYLS